MSDTEAILRALKAGRVLTPLDGLREFGSNRLAARIFDLRAQGHHIEAETVTLPNGKRISAYHLVSEPEQIAAGL